MPITRGCGKRKAGGLYVCVGLSPFGLPLEYFIIDPPIPYCGDQLRAPQLFEREGKVHIIIGIGAEYYPSASDFLEETRCFGISKRIPKNFPIEKLGEGSMIFLVHPRAIIENFSLLPKPEYCPKELDEHKQNIQYCIGHTYQTAEPTNGGDERKVGDTTYTVYPRGLKDFEAEFAGGIIFRAPITHFDHVREENGSTDPDVMARETGLPLYVVDD